MSDRVCQYGSCEETKIVITVNDIRGMQRPAFCSHEHAALYLLRHAWRSCPDAWIADEIKRQVAEILK